MGRWGRRSWAYAAAGLAVGLGLAGVPGVPSPAGWPARGPFGAFTWGACFLSTALAVTLLLVGAAAWARGGAPMPREARRVVWAAAGFALLAALAYAAAARVDLIERQPLAALALALAAAVAL